MPSVTYPFVRYDYPDGESRIVTEIPVCITNNHNNSKVDCYALIDTGADGNLFTKKLAENLGNNFQTSPYPFFYSKLDVGRSFPRDRGRPARISPFPSPTSVIRPLFIRHYEWRGSVRQVLQRFQPPLPNGQLYQQFFSECRLIDG
jgi:hypothetical protein